MAILGSLSAPVYAAGVRPATALLPGGAASAVHDSLAGAGVVAGYLPAVQREALLATARSAFVDGMGVAVLVGAVVAIAGALVAFIFLPGRGSEPVAQPAPELVTAVPGSLAEAA